MRHLDQLAPYGAENPTPVFLLQSAVVDGVYPVSEGRHSRLRLRQGNSCLYAVWFGMPAEQLPYALGDVVDAALNLSVYESARGAQLSSRIIDLHPPLARRGSAAPVRKAGRGADRQNAGGSCRFGAGGADHRSGKRRGKVLGAGADSRQKEPWRCPHPEMSGGTINA